MNSIVYGMCSCGYIFVVCVYFSLKTSIVQKIVQGTNLRPDFDEIERIPGAGDELSPIRSSPHSSPSRKAAEQPV